MGGLFPPLLLSGPVGLYASSCFNVAVCITAGADLRGDLGTERVVFKYIYGSLGFFTISPVGKRSIFLVAIPSFAETFTSLPLLLSWCAGPK